MHASAHVTGCFWVVCKAVFDFALFVTRLVPTYFQLFALPTALAGAKLHQARKFPKAHPAPDGTRANNTRISAKAPVTVGGAGAEWRLHQVNLANTLRRTQPGADVLRSVLKVAWPHARALTAHR